jgi:integrase
MKRERTRKNAMNITVRANAPFKQVFDDKKKRMRSLWERKGCYYAQLDANNGKQYKYPLHDATTLPQAVTEMQVLKKLQREGKLVSPSQIRTGSKEPTGENPDNHTLKDAIKEYKTHREELKADDEMTWAREDSSLTAWEEKYDEIRLNLIDDDTTKAFAKWRQSKDGGNVCGRTVDIDVGALHKVLARAVEVHWLPKSPLSKWKKLDKGPQRVVRLLKAEEIDKLAEAAIIDEEALSLYKPEYRAHLRKVEQSFADYLHLLALTGGREQETIRQRWSNAIWRRKVLFFPGKEAKAGGGRPAPDREVDLHAKLEKHLKAMYKRRDPNSDWMFPSADDSKWPTGSFRKQLERVKRATGMLDIGFHHFRHYFISCCVMAQPWIDYMTIAIWVSHRDKGVLIAKRYGHLRPGHTARMAKHLVGAFEY